MRCNVWGWLLGLPVLALIWGLAVNGESGSIGDDLERRTTAALQAHDLGWAATRFDVIEGTIRGRAYSEAERRRGVEIARRTWGVWNLRDETGLIDEAENYVWGASVYGRSLQLRGHFPNERARRRIIDLVREQFPDADIADEMRPARGAPGEAVWLEGVNFGLRQLAGLKQGGEVELEGTRFALSGEAKNATAYRTIKGDVRRRLPSGFVLARDQTTPPQVSPFTWRARFKANQLELSGHVPSEAVRGELVEIAKQTLPNAAIVDKMMTASGAPANWSNAVSLVLREMANLEEADAEMRDEDLVLKGITQRERTAQRITGALNLGRPDNIKIVNQLKFREPTLPTISPFTTTIVSDGETVSLTGVAPDERRRERLVAMARERFTGREVVDALTYASGAPTGWLGCAEAGLTGLARLDKGRAEMSDANLIVRGETRDEAVAREVPAEVRAAANRACEETVRVTLITPPEPNLVWQAVSEGKRLELSGEVINSAVQANIVAEARRLFPDHEVVDNLRVNPGRSTKWPKAAALGLEQLARLRNGVARLDGEVLSIDGVAPDTAAATQVRTAVTRNLPSGYRGQADLEIKSDAMIWSEQEARRKSLAAAAAKREEEEAKARAEAERRAAVLAEEQRRAAEAAARARAEAEARRREQEKADRRRAEAEARLKTEEESFLRLLEDERREAEAARRAAEDEARRQAEADARRRAEEARVQEEAASFMARLEEERRQEAQARARAEACKKDLNEAVKSDVVQFESDSAELKPESVATLNKLVAIYRKCPGANIEIAGHTDSTGGAQKNLDLSLRRAAAVRDYFVEAGLPRSNFVARGYGETRPLTANRTARGRALNRRIEFGLIVEE
jgi:OOP family OmpA-OmpF porin